MANFSSSKSALPDAPSSRSRAATSKLGESPEQAIVREVLEESGCHVSVTGLLGVYLWIQPQTRRQFLKVVYLARLIAQDSTSKLDSGIRAVHWYSTSDIKHRMKDIRTPVVLRCIEDYIAGRKQPENMLAGMMPLQSNVHAVIANAALV